MPSDKLVFVDTSVWIDYFLQKSSVLGQTMDALLENAQIATAAVILAELIQGARGTKEVEKLKEYFKPLVWIPASDSHWREAGELSFQLRRLGKKVNLTDCYIASLTSGASAEFFTLDKHFEWIASVDGCTLYR